MGIVWPGFGETLWNDETMTFVVLQVSDTHLSATHAYFTDNWQVFVDEVRALAPDLVINTGDFSFNGPAVVEDLAFSHAEAERLGVPYLAVPGNHDVGEPGDNPRLKQPVNDARLANWKRYFGDDRFVRDIESWRLIGINGELLGSGLPAEEDQWAFLETSLHEAADRSLGLFTHKPLFATEPDEVASKWSTLPEPRARLLKLLKDHNARFVASGHLHRYRYISHDGIDLVWCPTTAFITPSQKDDGCIRRVGYLKWVFDGADVHHKFVEPEGFTNHDMTWKTKKSGTTIALPEKPLAAQ